MTVKANSCHWPPLSVPKEDRVVYERIRSRVLRSHCAASRDEHLCCGRVTIDRSDMLLQCPLCGDLKLNTKHCQP